MRVTVECTDPVHRSLDIAWSSAEAVHTKLEYARIFLIAMHDQSQRIYLDIVDGRSSATVRLPQAHAPGEYAIEIDGYGSASWGDGKLDARGRSATFAIVAT